MPLPTHSTRQPTACAATASTTTFTARCTCSFGRLFFWAVDPRRFSRLLLLDVDLHVRTNLDTLLAYPLKWAIGAVACADNENYFNTGVVLLRPNLKTFRTLLMVHPGKKCENKVTDQSVLNVLFYRWDRLRLPYNVPNALHARAPEPFWQHAAIGVLHFTSEPKPWEHPDTLKRAFHRSPRSMQNVERYRTACGLGSILSTVTTHH